MKVEEKAKKMEMNEKKEHKKIVKRDDEER
jgi:hypothetical protein